MLPLRPRLFPNHFYEGPFWEFAFEEVDDAIFDLAFEDLGATGELAFVVSQVSSAAAGESWSCTICPPRRGVRLPSGWSEYR